MALFVEVAKTKSFTRAAESLDMPISTLSRRISQLEKSIGLQLLYRTTRKLELTEAGNSYFARCQQIVEAAQTAHEQLRDFSQIPHGRLRISMPVDFGTFFCSCSCQICPDLS
jgi:DNA-binding transcriptional LysR family regulator